MRILLILPLILATLLLSGCGYNTIQTTDENVTASWSEVKNFKYNSPGCRNFCHVVLRSALRL